MSTGGLTHKLMVETLTRMLISGASPLDETGRGWDVTYVLIKEGMIMKDGFTMDGSTMDKYGYENYRWRVSEQGIEWLKRLGDSK